MDPGPDGRYGTSDDVVTSFDILYYVMPYIEGETLRDKLNREKQLGIEEAVRITTEVADGLDYANRQSVIHRDIKPENILQHVGRAPAADPRNPQTADSVAILIHGCQTTQT